MGRISKMKINNEPTVYYVMSRAALEGFPFGYIEKDHRVELIQKLSRIYFSEILSYCAMGSHFHLTLRMQSESEFSDEAVGVCYKRFYGEDKEIISAQISFYRQNGRIFPILSKRSNRPSQFFIMREIIALDFSGGIDLKVSLLKKGKPSSTVWHILI